MGEWSAALAAYLSIERVIRAHHEQSVGPAREKLNERLLQWERGASFGDPAPGCEETGAIEALKDYEAELRHQGLEHNELRSRRAEDLCLQRLRSNAARAQWRLRARHQISRSVQIERIEHEAQQLLEEKQRRLVKLVSTPVADFADFTLKLEILFDEMFRHDSRYGHLIAELIADARSLHKARGA